MAMGLLSKNGVDFWKEVENHRSSNYQTLSNIDHVVGGNAICDLFCEKNTKCCITVYHTDRMIWMKSRVW